MKEVSYFRILLVHGNEREMAFIREIIVTNFSAVVYSAESQKEAMLLIDYHKFDLVIIDRELIHKEEVVLSEYAARSFLNYTSPIIYLNADESQKEQGGHDPNSIAVDYIFKPFHEKELIRILGLYFRFLKAEKAIQSNLADETKLRQFTETELHKSRQNFKNIVERSNSGIIIIDTKGIIQYINEAGEKIFLRKREELVDNPFGLLTPDNLKSEIDIIRKNGEIGTGEISTTATEWLGKPATLIMINDITAHKKLEKNLEEAKIKAQESDRLKTAFLANMSHEIRTPLNGIMGFTQLLESEGVASDRRQLYLNTIISCGDYLLGIINDIIDIAQIEAGQMTVTISRFNLIELLNEIEAIYQVNVKLISKNLKLSIEKPGMESLFIHSDPLRIKQIIANLINNAIKFTNQGEIILGCKVSGDDPIQFYVKDTGIGIPRKECRNIFDRFRQVDRTKEAVNEGNGLGLSISKALVKLLGGKIWVESKRNAGSTFFFTIHAEIDKELKKSKPADPFKVRADFRNKKILIVEDEETNFLFLQSVIKDYGTTIYWAKNGKEAIEIAGKKDIDLILMDMKLPLKSGYEATKEIRLLKPSIPIIAQTAYIMGTDKDKVFAAGCTDYIAKPIRIDELMVKINTYLN